MYPNLYYLFQDIFGLEISGLKILQSFGFMVAVAFLVANYVMTLELRRKEKEGLLKAISKKILRTEVLKQRKNDIITSGITGFLVGYKVLGLLLTPGAQDHPQEYLLSLEGDWLMGIILAAAMAGYRWWAYRKEELPGDEWVELVHPHQHMGNITIAAAISGLIGAKLFHNLENWSDFMADPMGALVSFSGLTFYGGLIFGAIAVLYLANRNGITWKHMLDVGAPAMMLAYGVGRLGCHISGDGDWGVENMAAKPSWLSWAPDWFWSYSYPHNVINEGVPIEGCLGEYCSQLPNPVFPTPLYEAIACILLFAVLWKLRTRIKIPGVLFGIYLIMNGLERFLIEKIRVNNEMANVGGLSLTQAEIISFSLVLIGGLGITYLYREARQKQKNLA